MKVLVFIDHDIICRHFVLSGVLTPLVAAADVKFVFCDDGGQRIKLDPSTLALGAPAIRLRTPRERLQLWRWLLFSDQLQPRLGRFERALSRFRWRVLGWKAATMLMIAGFLPFRPLFHRWIRGRLARAPYEELTTLLDRERPDVILHPSVLEGPFINDLVDESKARGIPCVVVMNSWDNPSTKRAVVGKPDWLLVWGRQTQRHAVRFTKIAPQRAVPFGVAQFDVFREKPRQSRNDLAIAHGIDPRKRLILFAGSNAKTDEFSTLSALDAAIEDGRLANASIIYRPHPWGSGGRGGERIAHAHWKHVTIHLPTRDYIAAVASGRKDRTLPDYRDTHDLLAAADVVVSPLSTILVEAVLHSKPVVVFAPSGAERPEMSWTQLPTLHFDEFIERPGVGFADDVATLERLLVDLIQPEVGEPIGSQLRHESDQFVEPFDRPWGDRLVEFLEAVALQRKGAFGSTANGGARKLMPELGE